MARTFLVLALVADVSASGLLQPRFSKPSVVAPAPQVQTALALRGGGAVDGASYIKAFSIIMGLYAVQMLAMPDKMVTMHFDMPSNPMLEFWIRGTSVSFFALLHCFFSSSPSAYSPKSHGGQPSRRPNLSLKRRRL